MDIIKQCNNMLIHKYLTGAPLRQGEWRVQISKTIKDEKYVGGINLYGTAAKHRYCHAVDDDDDDDDDDDYD
ncbi:hypothetical protein T265_05120 [Opisthorchis viverrini]|uniref:Uncharacterized protein n=1 Tax=Opisthorchis viverrini TaxID=6198 RepID=A0A075AFM3_OPIVI|nr:hypothetical protein T265_05120 [Opisthorchis viverrini]KER27914.1 hypothetical protein T265_05120 [Opisthorchis viverrini]